MLTLGYRRIAIVNRGEPAVRLIRAVREVNAEHGLSLRTVALFTDPDANSVFVREADASYCIGPPRYTRVGADVPESTYLDFAALERALVATRADSAWVGWGFVAEKPEFVELCDRLSILFIGPPAKVMRQLGDKIAAKRLAESSGLSVAPWSGGPVATVQEALQSAVSIGYPLLIKASAGGGGRGIRLVASPDDLPEALSRAQSEAARSFGDGTVFLEKAIQGARHVEVQVLADRYGTTWALGVRDCTLQRRSQKLMEEAPSPVLSGTAQSRVLDAAERLAATARYENAGTVEFLYDPPSETCFFMEMNTRLQVEHPVTEVTTGFDLVKAQLMIAGGQRLEGPRPDTRGHAIEVRLNAEDPDRDFAPSPGRVLALRTPQGFGVRIDSGIEEGDEVSPQFDSMVAKVIGFGRTRREALARVRRALSETLIAIEGGASNKSFLLSLLCEPAVVNNEIDVKWLDRRCAAGGFGNQYLADVAFLEAATRIHDEKASQQRQHFLRTAARGRPEIRAELGEVLEIRVQKRSYEATALRVGRNAFLIRVGSEEIPITISRCGPLRGQLSYAGETFRTVCQRRSSELLVEVNDVLHRLELDGSDAVCAPAPALVVCTHVAPGDVISTGDPLLVLEAMKTEVTIAAPVAGRVRDLLVQSGEQVSSGAPLVVLESPGDESQQLSAPSLVFRKEAPVSNPPTPAIQLLDALRTTCDCVLGYDIDPSDVATELIRAYAAVTEPFCADTSDQVFEVECDIVRGAAAILLLYGRDPVGEEHLTPRECLFRFVRARHTCGAGLPAEFMRRLREAAALYGVKELDGSVELLDEALFRQYCAYRRIDDMYGTLMLVLERWRHDPAALNDRRLPQIRPILEQLVEATRHRSFAVHELGLQLLFQYFDEPLLSGRRAGAAERMAGVLERLTHASACDDDSDVVHQIVRSSTSVLATALRHIRNSRVRSCAALLKGLVNRFYSYHQPGTAEVRMVGRHTHLLTQVIVGGRKKRVIATLTSHDALDDGFYAAADLVRSDRGPVDETLLDFFLWGKPASEALPAAAATLAREDLAWARVRRICATFLPLNADQSIDHVSLARGQSGYEEVPQYRGIHPMTAGALETWRLRDFETERLPAGEGVYLYRAKARTNEEDVRLFAFAEVHDAELLDRTNGRMPDVPQLHVALLQALACMRDHLYRRPPHKRPQANRVIIYLHPTPNVGETEISDVIRGAVTSTQNVVLEKIVVRHVDASAQDPKKADRALHFAFNGDRIVAVGARELSEAPIRTLSSYNRRVVRSRARGQTYPYEILRMIAPSPGLRGTEFPPGNFVEYDLDSEGVLCPVDRPPGENSANVVVGLITNITPKHPEGMTRVAIFGDGSRAMGALSEPECRRIIEALSLAEQMRVPVDWFPISAGAKIALDSGTENLDWTARVLRRIVELTEAGGTINVVVDGINVGAQSYWNAEATMLMHTKGILIMTPRAAMVLTGKHALDFSGSVSAEDNQGIGGADAVMGPNGETQYVVRDLVDACTLLFRHHDITYVAPGERFPRRVGSTDPPDRDATAMPYKGVGDDVFKTIGDLFSAETNQQRKRPFSIRAVMGAVVDQDLPHIERWRLMRDAEMAVVWDAHLGGFPALVIGIESCPIQRGGGHIPGDGPEAWTGGTLFPQSSKKVARALNAASGNRPAVILANLSGFDGSPESMRKLQLEYGAEIGRAVVRFQGPMVFCVISRYHGGAYVVFSRTLNENIEAIAIEDSFASVIGGAPAAAVVFAREVASRTYADPRVVELQARLESASNDERPYILAALSATVKQVRSEKQREVADEFDAIHTVQRAQAVGSLDSIIAASVLRQKLIEAVARGVQRCLPESSDLLTDAQPLAAHNPADTDRAPRKLGSEPLWARGSRSVDC